MRNLLFAIVLTLLSTVSIAHEGHGHAPGSFKSLHGGAVQAGKQLNLEVIINGSEVTLYPTNHEGKDIPTKDIKIEAMAKPKKGKPYSVVFRNENGGFKTKVDLKGANRLPINVNVTNQGKVDHFLIQVEE